MMRDGKAGLLAMALMATGLGVMNPAMVAAQMVVQAEQQVAFSIAAQALPQALTAFGRQSGYQVSFDPQGFGGLQGAAVSGTMTPEEALRRLLAGTGVTWRHVDQRSIALEPPPKSSGAVVLSPISVLGTRRGDVPLSNVPASISVVDGEEIRKEQATAERVEDVLSRRVPGFNPTNNGLRSIRGRTAQIFINGVPTNEQMYAGSGSDLNLLSLDQIDHIEVARGANSAYGFGSPGGIIALQTPRAESTEFSAVTKVAGSFNPHHPGGSWRSNIYQSGSQIIGAYDLHVGASIGYDGSGYSPDGDPVFGFKTPGALAGNGREAYGNFDTSLGYEIGDSSRLRFTGSYGRVNIVEAFDNTGGLYRQQYGSFIKRSESEDPYRESLIGNLTYENDNVLNSTLKVELLGSNTYTESYASDFFTGRTTRDEQTNQYYGLRSSMTTPLDAVKNNASVTYGLDALRNTYYRPNYFHDDNTIQTYYAPKVRLDSYAGFAQLDIPFGDLKLSGGLRHEQYRGHVETAVGNGGIAGGDINDFHLTLFNVGAVHPIVGELDGFASFSQGAEISQLARAARNGGNADRIDPQPAKSNQYELGLRDTKGSTTYSLATFYTESDLMSTLQPNPLNPTGPLIPLREPRQFWGIEATLGHRFDAIWSMGGSVSWMEGLREVNGDSMRIGIRDNQPLLASAWVDYKPYAWWRNTLQLDYSGDRAPYGRDLNAVFPDFQSGWVDRVLLVNVASAFEVGPGELVIGIRNLLNKKYEGIPESALQGGFLWYPEEGMRTTVSYRLKW